MDNSGMKVASELVKELISLLFSHGVRNIVCSPGSRNAMLLAEIQAHGRFKTHVIVDERSAAFIGMGMAMVSKRPVALVCTSGSALLNYAPAVAEAYYQGIPLIIVSADRPEEWIDQDDSQTIRQPGALNNYVKASYDIVATNTSENYAWYVNRIVNEGLLKSGAEKKGPVHFNIHLEGTPWSVWPEEDYKTRKISLVTSEPKLSKKKMEEFTEFFWRDKIMIVAGTMMPDNKLQKAMVALEKLPNVCIMAETVSNLHLPSECYMVDTVLFPLDSAKAERMRPHILISLGGALISRKLKEYLRRYPPKLHWALGFSDNIIDCFKCLDFKIEVNPAPFLQTLAVRMEYHQKKHKLSRGYRQEWNSLRLTNLTPLTRVPWSDLKALEIIFKFIPASANLFLSNGTSVRYGQVIPFTMPHAVYANRGVSGIEGCTSTAIGCSAVYERMTCLITGDMSFGYDIGALSSGMASSKFRIIVLDNRGGDIFRFIPATKNLRICEDFLCVAKKTPVEDLAKAYGFEYSFVNSEETLFKTIEDFFSESTRPKILHVSTRESFNSKILNQYLSHDNRIDYFK